MNQNDYMEGSGNVARPKYPVPKKSGGGGGSGRGDVRGGGGGGHRVDVNKELKFL